MSAFHWSLCFFGAPMVGGFLYFRRATYLCLFLFLGRWFFFWSSAGGFPFPCEPPWYPELALYLVGMPVSVPVWAFIPVLAPTLPLDLRHWGQVLPVFCLPHPPLPHQLAPRCYIPGLAIPLKGIPMQHASQSQCCLRSSCSPVPC
ncbi:hypothetical protein L211DRAFT_32245 [Terfezia boudieri ATCC MYA-4762]|uniref:Uncharacterized protein n=1 Tax=Terfezia boudieri ATCC MYA-4762 TaxID=1051890 RepID=A0A3N4M3B2_9PEZI|nr:hypothetical protein L211DRAFT_32245 [Terfezia boudieri ATCC MYA-4762]